MKDRILPLIDLEKLLDDNKLIFRYNEKEQMCRTFFRIGEKDYTQGQPQYTLLKKEKMHLPTKILTVQYDRMTPKYNL